MKNKYKNKKAKLGLYSIVISLIIIAVVILLNLILSSLPASYTEFETSNVKLYDFSADTVNLAKGLEKDVKLYYIGSENDAPGKTVQLLKRYADLSDKISVEFIDPLNHPKFSALSGKEYTSTELKNGMIIVSSDIRDKTVSYYDIYYSDFAKQVKEYLETYGMTSTLEEFFESSYGTSDPSVLRENGVLPSSESFSGEGALSSAIENVSTETLPVVYMLSGHGESEFGATVKGKLTDDNYVTEELKLLSQSSVPADAACVIIYCPTSDIADEEYDMLSEYLTGGGSVILFTNYQTDPETMTNICKIGEYYGITVDKGLLCDESPTNRYEDYPYYLLPSLGNHSIISSLSSKNTYVIACFANGLTIGDSGKETISAESLLNTSGSAYLRQDPTATLEKVDGDPSGSYSVAVAATEKISEKLSSNFIWFAAPIAEDSFSSFPGNSDIIMSSLKYATPDKEASISIAAKDTSVEQLVIANSAVSTFWAIILIAVIPIIVVAFGLIVYVSRKRR